MLNADRARSKLGIDGAGVTVGVLSDSFAQTVAPTSAAGDTATGDLPGPTNPCGHTTPVNVLDDSAPPPNADEGRAMAQTVHDLAPGANLAFATAFAGEDQFAANIQALATAGAKVIVDDVTYFDEPMYQDGVLSNAVSAVTDAGVAYFSSAANENMVISGRNVGSYEATNGYRPTPCPTVLSAYPDCHNFSTTGTDNTYGMTVAPGGVVNIDLQWAQPLFNVTSDLDAYLISSTGTILASSVDDNLMSEHPFELLQWPNTGPAAQAVRLVIARFSGPNPRFKFVHMENGSTGITSVEYPTSAGGDVVGPTIFGHNGAAKAGSVAAVPFDDANTPEYYTSHGPVTLLFGPVNGMTPAAPISPQVLAKPDFAATDCVRNTFFGELDGTTWRFCGTSDAAPHAAAVAALLRQHDPTLTPAQVQNTLATTASPVVNGSAVSTGAGLLNAYPAGNTTTTLAPSTIVAGPGQSVTFTATVTRTGVTPTGTVTFTDAGTTLAAATARRRPGDHVDVDAHRRQPPHRGDVQRRRRQQLLRRSDQRRDRRHGAGGDGVGSRQSVPGFPDDHDPLLSHRFALRCRQLRRPLSRCRVERPLRQLRRAGELAARHSRGAVADRNSRSRVLLQRPGT